MVGTGFWVKVLWWLMDLGYWVMVGNVFGLVGYGG